MLVVGAVVLLFAAISLNILAYTNRKFMAIWVGGFITAMAFVDNVVVIFKFIFSGDY